MRDIPGETAREPSCHPRPSRPSITAVLLLAVSLLILALAPPAWAQDDDVSTTDVNEFEPVVPQIGDEVIHSWTITAAGNNNETGAGSRSQLSYAGDPGTTIEDAVTVFNLGNQVLTFRVYATDGVNATDGRFALLEGSEEPTDVGSWVSVAQEFVTVAPGTASTIPITISIPADAAPGDHIGGVVASNEAVSTDGAGSSVVLDRRTATRLYLRVGGPIRPELAVENLSVDYGGSLNPLSGTATVSYTIANRGNVILSGSAATSVAGPLGLARQSGVTTEFTDLLPGQDLEVTTEVTGVPALLLAAGRVELEAEQVGDGAGLGTVVQEASTLALPFAILLLVALAVSGWFARRARNRHRDIRERDEWSPPELALQPKEEELVS